MHFFFQKKIGNALRLLLSQCFLKPTTTDDVVEDQSLGHHGVCVSTVGLSALAQDLYNFEITSQVPEGLSKHVASTSKKTQAKWFTKLSKTWRESKPPPKTPEEASRLIVQTLKRHLKADLEGLLTFYGLPLPDSLIELSFEEPQSPPEGLLFEFQTLPISAKAVADGDGMAVYVSTKDPRESACVPREVEIAVDQRSKARAKKNYPEADAFYKKITDMGYRMFDIQNEEVLARKYRIRLRGIDAPECGMKYGPEAKEELVKLIQGKCLKVLVFAEDRYGRFVGDVYSNGIFVQELLLKKGMAWHYIYYDKRPELAKWEKEARAKRLGLWAFPNPEKPWEWRRKNKREEKEADMPRTK